MAGIKVFPKTLILEFLNFFMNETSDEEINSNEETFVSDSAVEELDKTFENKELEDIEKVEAVLFISAKLLTFQELITLTDVNPIMLKGILHTLEKKYSKGAIRLVNRGNSWKMDVAEKYNYIINKLATGSSEFTKAEQETLAVIAYKQPVKQSVIIKIRGNKSYDHIKRFRELKLIDSKKIGHTYELSLSEDFYNYFNVNQRSGESLSIDEINNESKE